MLTDLKASIKKSMNAIGVEIPEIMLPNKQVDLKKWAVVACDQYTSQRSYWHSVEQYVSDSPSTLHMIFPEVYLEDENSEQRIANIVNVMHKYIDENVLVPLPPSLIYVERTLSTGIRKGLMIALDLEKYDYHEGSQSLIRATEGTVLDRLPPRVKIRKNAVLEVPHTMVLIDDPEKTVIEPISREISEEDKLYDFELMMNGGRIAGYQVKKQAAVNRIINALAKLADPLKFREKYNVGEDKGVMLFAMGDGNHSFAAAKACWESLKTSLSEEERQNHPARFALVELVNVHDDSLVFEPIHRVLFQADPFHVLNTMKKYYTLTGQSFDYESFTSKKQMKERYRALKSEKQGQIHLIPYMFSNGWGILKIANHRSNLEAGTLQAFLDYYLDNNKDVCVDYIHGEEITAELGTHEGNMGFLLPMMNKNDFFKTIILDGVLPRKTFSMGEAHEKRYYLECRKIIK